MAHWLHPADDMNTLEAIDVRVLRDVTGGLGLLNGQTVRQGTALVVGGFLFGAGFTAAKKLIDKVF